MASQELDLQDQNYFQKPPQATLPTNEQLVVSSLAQAEHDAVSLLNRWDSLLKLDNDAKVRALTGSQAIQAVTRYLDVAPNKAAAYAQLEAKLTNKFAETHINVKKILLGGVAEYQIQNLVSHVSQNIHPEFQYLHAEDEVDIAGIDAFITTPQDRPEFINHRTGKRMSLALSIKSVPLPAAINDVFYPCRTQSELDEGLEQIIDDYHSLRTNLHPRDIDNNINRITQQMTAAFRRLHGYEYDEGSGEWFKLKGYTSPIADRSSFIPVITLASSQAFAPIGNYGHDVYFPVELSYTAEFQLTDNPEKWDRRFYTSDGYLEPDNPFAT